MQHGLVFVTITMLAGCSWIYNPNNLGGPPSEAGIDAPSDAEIILDADPTMLVINGVAPATIYEGQGDGGSAPAMVVLSGHNMIDNNTTVELMPASGAPMIDVGPPTIAKDGNWIAIPVTAHVDMALAKTAAITFDIRVSEDIPGQPGMRSMSTLSGQLTLQGLEELAPGATFDTTTLDTRYSKVTFSGMTTTFTGSARAIIHSMSSITATATALAANGANGINGTAAAAVGGCSGGGPSSPGGCDATVGGKAGVSGGLVGGAGGGGGGGFGTDGMGGTGNGAGAPGSRTGDELITTYDGYNSLTPNRAGGGGGGGTGVTGGNGGGGAGGGSIELTAEGDVTTSAISVNGGAGQAAPIGTTTMTGGGGGAGGLVMLRAGGTLTTTGAISVNGGAGGTGSSGAGGMGAPGRVRWDAAVGTGPAASNGTLHRGPAFVLDTRLFRAPVVRIALNGAASDHYDVYAINYGVNGAVNYPGPQITVGPDGKVSYLQTLQQGLSHLCVTIDSGKQGASEADTCVDVAFLP
ncbi:MAG TPA: hypothetical protein VH165_21280 [Kofleriaceae bacterium]|nr:hypothetical protein [Kofleriaceae bacterium]